MSANITNVFQNLEFGNATKMFFLFSKPWWMNATANGNENGKNGTLVYFTFHWTDADRKEFAEDVRI